MRRFLGSVAFVGVAALLAGCGGGGSGSPGGGITPPVHTNAVTLHGGFEQTSSVSRSAAGVMRLDATRSPLDVNLTALPLAAIFDVPDSYITGGDPAGLRGAQVIAYLTTSDGTLSGIPGVLPTPSVSETGPQIPIGSPVPAPSPIPSAPPISLGGFNLSAPTTAGQTVLTLSATVNGQAMTTTVKGDNYPELCVASSDSAGTSGGSYGCPAGLYWDAQGVDHATSTVSNADVYLQFDSTSGTTTLNFPYGAALVTGSVPIYNTLSTVSTTQTSFTSAAIYTAEANGSAGVTFIFKTQSGLYVKWAVAGQTAGAGTTGINGDIAMMAGPYLTTTSTTFAY